MKVAVFFGGRSSEHDISVLTGILTVNSIKEHEVFPIYIGKDGRWRYSPKFTSVNALDKRFKEVCLHPFDKGLFTLGGKRICNLDVCLICCHGAYGEDGALAGVLEHSDIPYAPGGVLSGAVGMDKVTQKRVFRDAGISVLDFFSVEKFDYREGIFDYSAALKDKFPVIVKPSSAGSSIGIGIARDYAEFFAVADKAFAYDDRIIVEHALQDYKEYNCAVLGMGDTLVVSQIEQPVSKKEFLDYSEKYSYSGGAQRIFPAEVDENLRELMQEQAKLAFRALKCYGVARVDFLYDGQLYLNEINTVPGSMSSYLFDYDKINFSALSKSLIDIAIKAHTEKSKLKRATDGQLLLDTRLLK
ncbi:MAG: D-alanine--D-alanine ligase [Clostridia bacterium]|nr:D-alanine--D-alanine ligase [Clostridia bacterium]